MGLSLALMAGKENFDSFRIGARNMDKHFYEADISPKFTNNHGFNLNLEQNLFEFPHTINRKLFFST